MKSAKRLPERTYCTQQQKEVRKGEFGFEDTEQLVYMKEE